MSERKKNDKTIQIYIYAHMHICTYTYTHIYCHGFKDSLGYKVTSQEIAISGSLQQNLAGICNGVSVWRLIMGWISGWVVSRWSILSSQLQTLSL